MWHENEKVTLEIIVEIELLNAPECSLRAIRSRHTSLTFISVVFCSCFVCITFILCLFVVVLDCGHFGNLRAAVAQEIQWSSTYQRTDDLIPDNYRQHVNGSLGKIQNPKFYEPVAPYMIVSPISLWMWKVLQSVLRNQ